ncbi:histidine kinase dimerization/phospho-acceptor domain-containing protein [Rhodoferax saidenbachensis]|uniref:histidine kinase n=1 Tax=Rhodoferax saidenbachensis TaxID=1484693 RepID=A0A1P8K634_9BURK|nr:histidine kinase dimerization/phospho-acceptor domain-containing protein [Rhodoferax saidenbachensis]APW41468.1 hypothetical protein RS694_02120 [Rhodoferax saidenbachensis]
MTAIPPDLLQRLPASLEDCAMGVGLFDPEDHLRWANAFFLEALATTVAPDTTWESMMRRCHRDRVGVLIDTPDIEAWLTRVRATYRKSPLRSFESDYVDGRWLRVCETLGDDGWMLITTTDITSLKTNETALQRARDEAVLLAKNDIEKAMLQQAELHQLKSDFVTMTSHEFRTPLANILSSTELLKHYGDRLPDAKKAELTNTIEVGVARMTELLSQLLRMEDPDAPL